MTEPLEISFRDPGNSLTYRGTGWSVREVFGIWMFGDESTLILPRPATPGDYLLELEVGALLAPGRCEFQRLSIRVNGVGVGNFVVRGDDTMVECWVPWSVLGGPMKNMVILSHPDGWKPSELTGGVGDERVISLFARTARLSLLTERAWAANHLRPDEEAQLASIIGQQEGVDGVAMHELMLDFESLGSNCELGMVQRHYGVEPLGLFRFSYTPLQGLLAALEGDFRTASFGDQASLVLNSETREYELVDRAHGFEWHTWQYDGQTDADALERQELVRLPYLVRRFYETLEDGEKILVLRDEDGTTERAVVDRLLAALRRHGDVTVLWVSVITGRQAPGDVEWVGDRLLHGWIDRLSTRREANNASMFAWGVICQRTHRMWQASRKTGIPAFARVDAVSAARLTA